MSIVKMKHLRLLGMQGDRDELLRQFQLLGCVQISEPDWRGNPDWAALATVRSPQEQQRLKARYDACVSALAVLNRYAPVKTSLFTPKPEIPVTDLFSDQTLAEAEQAAAALNTLESQIRRCAADESRLNAAIAALEPWSALDVPLDYSGSAHTVAVFGTLPAATDLERTAALLEETAPAAELLVSNVGRELDSVLLLCHSDSRAEALAELRGLGFSAVGFKEMSGTAKENIAALHRELNQVLDEAEAQKLAVENHGGARKALQLAVDRLTQELDRAEQAQRLLNTGTVFALEGWVPAPKEAALTDLLAVRTCAWELDEPASEEYPDVPIQLKNNWFTKPLNMVTDMYSLPAYDGVDPNPLMAPFFILFYGIMMADMGYGLLMMLGCLIMLKGMHASGGMKNFAGLLGLCGATTFLVGALTGGFFGDFIPQIAKIINPDTTLTALPALFTPLTDTIAILIGSLVLGFIQILTGMIVSVVGKVRSGDFIDALFSEITWWIILGGAALAILGVGSISGIPVVLLLGILMLAVGGTRNAKGFGKVTSFVGLVYNGISGFFSDILSYARIMALMLAGSVIAQVFNTLGGVTGNIIGFVLISLIGNTLNFALNLLGCYVHDLRLQCLEFFGRFYKEGGKPFQPLAIKTKYHNICEHQ